MRVRGFERDMSCCSVREFAEFVPAGPRDVERRKATGFAPSAIVAIKILFAAVTLIIIVIDFITDGRP